MKLVNYEIQSTTEGRAGGIAHSSFRHSSFRHSSFRHSSFRHSSIRHSSFVISASGFTLLEIILALAILAGSLAALGEVMRLADQNAAMTRDETQAQILAASIMDELIAGARSLSAVDQAVFDPDWDPQWLYSIAWEPTAYEELIAVRVRVEQQLEARLQPAQFDLVRWLPNPGYVPAGTGGAP